MIVAIPALRIALQALLRIVLVWALRVAYAVTLGLMLRYLSSQVGRVPLVGGKLRGAVEAVDGFLVAAIAKSALAADLTLAKFYDGVAILSEQASGAVVWLAESMYRAVENLVSSTIPLQVEARTKAIGQRAAASSRAQTARERAERQRVARGIDSVRRDLRAEALARQRGIDRVRTQLRAQLRAGDRRLGRTIARDRGFVRDVVLPRIGRLEKAVGATAIAAVVLATLARAMPWYRCGNVNAFNRALCRAPTGALNWLFALVALLFVTLNPEQVAGWADDTAEFLDEAWRTMAGV